MTTTTKSQQLSSGYVLCTLTAVFTEGEGWLLRKFESWKGQEAEEVMLSGATWRSTEEECLSDLELLASDMRKMGWK